MQTYVLPAGSFANYLRHPLGNRIKRLSCDLSPVDSKILQVISVKLDDVRRVQLGSHFLEGFFGIGDQEHMADTLPRGQSRLEICEARFIQQHSKGVVRGQ